MKARHFIHRDLADCTHVFRRIDAVKPPLTPPYTGPHQVLRRLDPKRILIEVNGEPRTVSIDVVKPAYIARDEPPAQPTRLAEAEPHPIVSFQILDQQPATSTSCLPHSSATRGGVAVASPSEAPQDARSTVPTNNRQSSDASSVSSPGRSTDDRRRASQPRHH